jgi:rod shape-determining protein MreC
MLLLGTRYSVLSTVFMESVLGRYRNLTILVGVLFLQVLGLAMQVKRSADAEHTRLIRIWAVDAITPLERIIVRAQNGTNNLWHNYFYLRGVRAENRQLKEQIEQMRLEQVRLNEDAAQARRLQSLLAFKEQVVMKTVPAQVIGSSGSDLSRSIYIDKGSDQGIAADMPVITASGIVGKVLRTYPSTSLVLMINDQSSGVGVLLEKSRLQGVLRGTPDGELILERVTSDEQVTPGETVLSSGGDQIFPKGFPVGTVMKVSPGKELFLDIKVHAAADLSRLEEVLVMTEKQERQVVAEGAGKVRAADILAQRLPSVPDKSATVAGATGTATGKSVGTVPGSGSIASAKPGANVANKPVAGAGTGIKLAERPAPRLAPASTSSESPVKSGNAGARTGPANAAGSNGAASNASSVSTPTESQEKPAAVPANPSTPQSHHQPATEANPN